MLVAPSGGGAGLGRGRTEGGASRARVTSHALVSRASGLVHVQRGDSTASALVGEQSVDDLNEAEAEVC